MKIWYYTVIVVGIIILFNMAGISTPAVGGLVDSFGFLSGNQHIVINSSSSDISLPDVQSTPVWLKFIAVLALAGGAAVIIGLFSSFAPIQYLTATFTLFFGILLLEDLWSIEGKILSFNNPLVSALSFTILIPLMIGAIIALVEWWQNRD